MCSRSFETRSLPSSLATTHRGFALITRSPRRPCASYPSCVAVYPRDSRSRRVLCRWCHQLHCISAAPAALDRYLAALPAMSLIPSAPFSFSRPTLPPLQLSPAACRWNDTVHTQIFDHLPVVIERVSSGECCQEQASGRSATARANRLDKVRRV